MKNYQGSRMPNAPKVHQKKPISLKAMIKKYKQVLSYYDGLHPKAPLQVYVCQGEKCQDRILTVTVAKGVIPNGVSCLSCKKSVAIRQSPRLGDDADNPYGYWYRPTMEQMKEMRKNLTIQEMSHILSGGLLFTTDENVIKNV